VLPLIPVKRRIALQSQLPRAAVHGLVLGLVTGVLLGELEDILPLVLIALALTISSRIATVIIVESHGPPVDESAALYNCDQGSLEQALASMPLFPSPVSHPLPPPLMTRGLVSAQMNLQSAQSHLDQWWNVHQSQTSLAQSEQDQFNAVVQAIYASEARLVGSAFARRGPKMSINEELARARALSNAVFYQDWQRAVDACVNIIDAQVCFISSSSPPSYFLFINYTSA